MATIFGCAIWISASHEPQALLVVRDLFGAYPDTVISGFHMVKKSDYTEEEADVIRQTTCELLKTRALFYTGHCTGQKAFAIMKEMMGERLQGFHSGSRLEV